MGALFIGLFFFLLSFLSAEASSIGRPFSEAREVTPTLGLSCHSGENPEHETTACSLSAIAGDAGGGLAVVGRYGRARQPMTFHHRRRFHWEGGGEEGERGSVGRPAPRSLFEDPDRADIGKSRWPGAA